MSISGVGNAAMQNIDLQNMDIETLLMTVQSQRAQLLDVQLANQIQEVQNRNDKIAKLNAVLTALNKIDGEFKKDKSTEKLGKDLYQKHQAELKEACDAAGISLEISDKVDNSAQIAKLEKMAKDYPGLSFAYKGQIDSLKMTHNPDGGLSPSTKKGDITTAINNVKGQIDAANNSTQMDMLRLQSLTNKRNEAFDVMTNFIKKMQDSRSAIIGNMR
ncbi:hypothetical protein [Comamonas flocculans]|uniref:Uncharacterized protein n=1 Tax=Comamonas flocculans TaxID=2597701 RepID=A0A5B8RUL0_9BURK|nr:hypothetical protein [Comamonas flocculans]QEA13170.1 hypothetical protein FOZ74_09075 [Comamonas flocculans]